MRYPIIRQCEATDCGPAVLAMIAAFYKKPVSVARLKESAGTGSDGTTLAGLRKAGEEIGFQTRAVRATPDALPQIALPAIAHWHEGDRNHFVVLYKVSSKRVMIADPAAGRRKLSTKEFLKCWTGVLLLLTPAAGQRNTVNSKSILKISSLLLPHHRLFLDALVAAVLLTILNLTLSFFIQALVDMVFVAGRKPALNWLGLGMLLVTLARAGFLGLRSCLLAHLSKRIDAEMVIGYHRHLLGLPLTFFSSRRTGEILSRMNGAMKIRVAAGATTMSAIVDAILMVVTAGVMIWLNWQLALRSLQLLLASAGLVWLINKPMRRHQRSAMEKGAEFEAQMIETLGSIDAIKTYRAEDRIQLRAEACVAEMLEASFSAQLLAVHSATIVSLLAGLSTLGLLWFGGHQVLDGAITAGQLMALHTMLGSILGPIERLAAANASIQDAIVAAERMNEVLDLDPELSAQRSTALDRPIAGSIEFQDVSFRYGSRAPVFEHINIRIEAGECVGIVGESGSGKTTLVNMLARLFEPSAGRILIDGADIQDYTLDCLRREIVFVPQDVIVFNGTIADNIRFARPEASAEEIRSAAACAGLRPNLDTVAGERGIFLSRAERRRIAIARAILANPAILVLDEPDPESELAVQSLIDQRRGHRTTIVISHRPLQVGRVIHLHEKSLRASVSS